MPVAVTVLGAGLLAGLTAGWWARRSAATIADVGEQALVDEFEEHPYLVRLFHRLGRRLGGGVLVLAAFGVVLALATLAGAVLDMVNGQTGFARWDETVAQWGADHATSWSVALLIAVTQLGSSVAALILVAALGYLGYRRRQTLQALWFMGIVYVGHTLISNTVKWLVARERPPVEHLVETASPSFPSTHSGTAAAVWAAAALVATVDRDRVTKIGAVAGASALAVAVAASRALLGVHWLTDVIAGLAIGWGWFLVVAVVFGGRYLRFGEPVERVERETASR